MNILGIETSCDETAAAVVRDGREVLSNVVVSSLNLHKKFGGIIPEIASRRQLESISLVVREALKSARLDKNRIGAVAVTQSPGLIGSLLVGLSYARALACAIKKPLVEVDHVKAHLYAAFLSSAGTPEASRARPRLPAVGLIVSGGHTSLYYIRSWTDFRLIGKTRDDAAGEAYDKVARILNLGYPGGPVIDRLARQGGGKDIPLRCADLPGSYDFSFSGIKTAVLYYSRQHQPADAAAVAYSFQKHVVAVLVKKSLAACHDLKARTLVLGGGVAANSGLRAALARAAAAPRVKVFFPPSALCMDNAAMVSGFAYQLKKN